MTDNHYSYGQDYISIFCPAADESKLDDKARDMLGNNVDVVLADGNKALQVVHNRDPNMTF